eukprot:7501463-Pyramimonas_sp.AAC.1
MRPPGPFPRAYISRKQPHKSHAIRRPMTPKALKGPSAAPEAPQHMRANLPRISKSCCLAQEAQGELTSNCKTRPRPCLC